MRMRFPARPLAVVCLTLLLFCLAAASAAAAEAKVATISIQKILGNSLAAQEAQKALQAELDRLQAKFKADEDALDALEAEIKKKSSVWSEEIRMGKTDEYKKKRRDLDLKVEDAKQDLQQLEKKMMDPILKELHDLIAEIGKKNGYTMILENTMKGLRNRTGLLYADDSLDISDLVQKELDARLKK